ncbi:MAG TPA: YcxB family protein [Clostridia bacterium]|nr:YcxB family protein [Clostridia bacterium]
MDKIVKVQVNYSDKDISSALIEYINKIYHIWVVLLCLGVLFIFAVCTGLNDGFSTKIYGWLIILVLLILLVAYYYYYRPGATHINAYRERRENLFIFSYEKTEIIRKLSQSTCCWELFIKAYETKNNFFLLDKSNALAIVPKRFFENDDEVKDLREILKEKLKDSFIYRTKC